MKTGGDRNWTAQIVISSDHAGLRPHFKRLEAEVMHVLARVDDPRDVRDYLDMMIMRSKVWGESYDSLPTRR